MMKITIEREEPSTKIEAKIPEDSTVTDVFEVFNGMLVSFGYQWVSIERVIKTIADSTTCDHD